MFLALAAILSPGRPRAPGRAEAALPAGFLAAGCSLLIVPLSLLGASWSRLLVAAERAWRPAANGSLIALAILGAAVLAAAWWRRSAPKVALVALLSFGLANAIQTPATQPAHLYDVRYRCSFRRDFFSALLEADPVLGAFAPDNHARWRHPRVTFDQPQFDGRDWCHDLPVDTVARNILLSRYFYTTTQFANDFRMPDRVGKVLITGRDPADVEALLREFRAAPDRAGGGARGLDLDFVPRFSRWVKRPTFSVLVQGYEAVPSAR
jgi:hypothetical protein